MEEEAAPAQGLQRMQDIFDELLRVTRHLVPGVPTSVWAASFAQARQEVVAKAEKAEEPLCPCCLVRGAQPGNCPHCGHVRTEACGSGQHYGPGGKL
jgi:hypothetical protein